MKRSSSGVVPLNVVFLIDGFHMTLTFGDVLQSFMAFFQSAAFEMTAF